jgi:hypothetical protein
MDRNENYCAANFIDALDARVIEAFRGLLLFRAAAIARFGRSEFLLIDFVRAFGAVVATRRSAATKSSTFSGGSLIG